LFKLLNVLWFFRFLWKRVSIYFNVNTSYYILYYILQVPIKFFKKSYKIPTQNIRKFWHFEKFVILFNIHFLLPRYNRVYINSNVQVNYDERNYYLDYYFFLPLTRLIARLSFYFFNNEIDSNFKYKDEIIRFLNRSSQSDYHPYDYYCLQW
jgi:hypothetical protein